MYQFTCLPNGLSSVPRIFTKLLKPDFENVAYIDDTYLKGNTFSDCETNISTTVRLFTDLRLTLNIAKSVVIPSQVITFLGFVLYSIQMTVSLTPSNALKLKSKVIDLLDNEPPTTRTVSKVIGLTVASFLSVMHGCLYCQLDNLK